MKKWNRVSFQRRESMQNKEFTVQMTKDEMLKFYTNKKQHPKKKQ